MLGKRRDGEDEDEVSSRPVSGSRFGIRRRFRLLVTFPSPSWTRGAASRTVLGMDRPCAPAAGERSLPRRWWLEVQLALLLLLLAGVYFTRIGALTIRGEESRRAVVAREMLDSSDWVVPREQGEIFPDRPPLGNWAIALSMLALDDRGLFAVRLPSVMATLLTAVLIYGYSRRFLSPLGALAAGSAYATFGQVLELGGLAETEATFTYLVAASLLAWHWGYTCGWPRWRTWCAGYVFAALAALAKGPQAPVYFSGACILHLILRRDWPFLFSWAHAAGLAAGAAVVAAWQIPYSLAVPWPLVVQTWGYQASNRFDYSDALYVARHMASFPFKVAVCLMPWSVLLTAFGFRQFRRTLGDARPYVEFLLVSIGFAFASCWLAPHARTRYLMPLYPCFAPLIGLVVERAVAAVRGSPVWTLWRWYLHALAALMVLAALAAPLLSWPGLTALNEPIQTVWFGLSYSLASALLAAAAFWATRAPASRSAVGVLAVAAFLGFTWTGAIVNWKASTSEDAAAAVARFKERLPAGVRLASLGLSHHLFTYYYGETIPVMPWPESLAAVPDSLTYFCFDPNRQKGLSLPFPWEQVGVFSCDRNRQREPIQRVIVGRRVATGSAGMQPVPPPPGSRD